MRRAASTFAFGLVAGFAALWSLGLVPRTEADGPPPAARAAEKEFLVGFADDLAIDADAAVPALRELGVRALLVPLSWDPGQRAVGSDDARLLATLLAADETLRVVVSVRGSSGMTAPVTAADRTSYCAYLADVLDRFPRVRDLVLWPEPNSRQWWRAGAASYFDLVALCYDVAHGARANANVIGPATSSTSSPAAFIRELGRAYRNSGRTQPIFDTIAHRPLGSSSAERPWRRHRFDDTIGLGDWQALVQAYSDAFSGTAQRIPGACSDSRCVPLWYVGTGFQSIADTHKTGLYAGTETGAHPLPDAGGGELSGRIAVTTPAPDQATQIRDALRLAYCQPAVEAFFNERLVDESKLEGWQSGVLWADYTPKDSAVALARAVAATKRGTVNCTRLKGGRVPTRFIARQNVDVVGLAFVPSRTARRGTPTFAVQARFGEDTLASAALYRVGGASARTEIVRGPERLLRAGRTGVVRVSGAGLAAGRYQLEVRLTSAANPMRSALRTGPIVDVGAARAQSRHLAALAPPPAPGPVLLSAIPSEPSIASLPPTPQLGAPEPRGGSPLTALASRIDDVEPTEAPVVAAINALRRSRGLRPLSVSPALARAGDAHARALGLAGAFTHDWPSDGRPFSRWIVSYYRQVSSRPWSAGENLLWSDGEVSAEEMIASWMASPSHRRILLKTSWREVGVGIVRAEGATGVFGGRTVYVVAAEFGIRG